MQRINWFPDPLITGTMKIETGNNAKIDYLVVNNRNWLRATSVAAGDNYGQYTLLESRLPPAGTYHVHALTYAQKATADFRIYARVDGTYRMLLDVPVGDDMTITIDQNITIPSNTDQLLVRIAVGQKTGGALIKIRPEGDIVYQKQIVPTSVDTKLDQLIVSPSGVIMVGGNDLSNSYYAQLRPDGTELTSYVDNGVITGMTQDPGSQTSIITLYDRSTSRGKVVKFSNEGRRLYEKNTSAAYTPPP